MPVPPLTSVASASSPHITEPLLAYEDVGSGADGDVPELAVADRFYSRFIK